MGDEKVHYESLSWGMRTMRFCVEKKQRLIPNSSPKGRVEDLKFSAPYKKMSRLYVKDGSSKHEFSNYTKSKMSVRAILSCAQAFIH